MYLMTLKREMVEHISEHYLESVLLSESVKRSQELFIIKT